MEQKCNSIISEIKIMKKIMVIVLASTLSSYAYAQTGNTNPVKSNSPIVKKNKSKRLPPPPPPPPAPPIMGEYELWPTPPAPPAPEVQEESTMMTPPPPPPPPPPHPFNRRTKKITKTKI